MTTTRFIPDSLGLRLTRALSQALATLLVVGCAVGAPPAHSNDADDEIATPPARVGKIGLLSGPVTQTDLQTNEQQPASLNWPLTSGQRLSTGPVARAEVRIGSLAVRLDADSDVDFTRVDDEVIQIVVQRGTVALRVRSRELLPEIDLITPRERIVLDDVGRYRVDVDRAAGITALSVHVGAARIASGRSTFAVRSGQRGEFGTAPGTGFTLVQLAPDTFDDWVASRERRDDALASTRYVSPETTGVEALDDHGTWRRVPEYGTVWFPSAVPVGWAPYRHGRWAYVAPWGWTWIDEAPWGFAPFHYGRWAVVGGVWGWVPGAYVARPVYAPALVAWYGAPGVSVSIGFGSVGWFPLGPREVYIPPYRYNRRYITGLNYQHVGNINYGRINPPPRYVHQNPRTSTWVPNDAIARQEPIRRVLRTPPPEATQFVGRPTPPPSLSEGIKRGVDTPRGPNGGSRADGRPAFTPPGQDIVRPQPAPGTATPPAGSKFNVPRPPADLTAPAPDTVVRPQPAPQAAPSMRRDIDPPARRPQVMPEAPVRAQPAPRPEFVRPEPPAPPPTVSAPRATTPSSKFEQVAPPVRVAPPRVEAPAPRAPQVEAPTRVAPPQRAEPPRVESPRAESPRAEPPRAEPPRGSKFQQQQ